MEAKTLWWFEGTHKRMVPRLTLHTFLWIIGRRSLNISVASDVAIDVWTVTDVGTESTIDPF